MKPVAFALVLLTFSMAQAQVPGDQLQSFSNSQVNLIWANEHWKVVSGSTVIKDMGKRENDAREAFRIIRQLRLNQHATIGSPKPVVEYWLADGQAPRAFGQNLRTYPFDPEALRVDEIQGQWSVHDTSHVYFTFGGHADDAQAALAVIHRYHFNQIGSIGYPEPVMMYFLTSDRPATLQPARMAPAPLLSAKMREIKFQDPGNPMSGQMIYFGRQLSTPRADRVEVPVAEHVPIDWRQLELLQDNGEWKLVCHGRVLAGFGHQEHDARMAQAALIYYRVSDLCFIGKPPVFSFYLSSGQAPRGLRYGLNAATFDAGALRIIRDGADFAIADGTTILWHLGPKEEDANHVVEAIRHYRFDHLCRIGYGDNVVFNLLVRSH
jgi:hypothetical protein